MAASVNDGRYPPRGYEPARWREPPREQPPEPFTDYLAQEDSVPAMEGVTATSRAGYEPSAAENIGRIYGEASRQQAAGPPGRGRVISPEEAAVPGYFDQLMPNVQRIGNAISDLPRSDLGASWLGGRETPAPRTATGRAATTNAAPYTPPEDMYGMPARAPTRGAPSATQQAEHTPHPTIPGVYQRVGANGQMEFYDIPSDRRAAGPGRDGGYRIPDEARQLRQQAQWAQINARALMEKAAEYPGTPYAQRLQARAQALLGDAAQDTQFAQLVMEQSGAIEANRARAGSGGGDGIYDVARALQVDQERARELMAPPEEVTSQLAAVRKRAEADPRAANDLQRTQAALNIVQNTRSNYATQYGQIPSWQETVNLLLSDDFYENDPETFTLIDFAFGRQGFADGGMVMADPVSFSKGGYVPQMVMTQKERADTNLRARIADQMLKQQAQMHKLDVKERQQGQMAAMYPNMHKGRATGGAASVGGRGGASELASKMQSDPNSRASVAAQNFKDTGSTTRWNNSAGMGPSDQRTVNTGQQTGANVQGGTGGGGVPGNIRQQRNPAMHGILGGGGDIPSSFMQAANKNAAGGDTRSYSQGSGGNTVKKANGGAVQRYATGGLTVNSTSTSTAPSGAFPSLLSAMGGIFAKKETGMGIENVRQDLAARNDAFQLASTRAPDQSAYWNRQLSDNIFNTARKRTGGYAEGGYVEDDMPDDVMLGLGGPAPQMGAMDMMGGDMMGGGIDPMEMEYEEYAASAQQLGLPPLSFEQYISLMQQAPAGGQGMPQGDPSVGGKMVVDPDPNAPTDSIPAMIDGQQPAALDSGEFVIPRHAVLFHGVDKLKKLIAQAEAQEARG